MNKEQNMEAQAMACPQCGAPLPDGLGTVACQYCGMKSVLPPGWAAPKEQHPTQPSVSQGTTNLVQTETYVSEEAIEMNADHNDGRERDDKFLAAVGVAGAIGIVALVAHSGADVIAHTLIEDVRVAGANLGVNPDTAEASVRGLMVGLEWLRNIALFALLPSILNAFRDVDTD